MRQQKIGFCSVPVCKNSLTHVRLNKMLVFLGGCCEESEWFCDAHYADLEAGGFDYEMVQPVIETAGPPTKKIQRNSRKRELQVAEDIGGRRQPGSGSQPFAKGDIRKKGEFRVEHKDCYGLEFKVHRRDLFDKIRSECSRGEQPAVVVTFRDKHTHQQLEAWAMVPYEVWVEKMNGTG